MTLKPYSLFFLKKQQQKKKKTVHWRQLFHLSKPLILDTHCLCLRYRSNGVKQEPIKFDGLLSKSNVTCYFRGQANDKICQCEKSRLTFYILSKREDFSLANVQFEFRQVLRHYCCCRYCIHKNNNDQLPPIICH